MGLAIGDAYEAGQHAAVIKTDMEFHGTLGGAELRPGKQRQAQVNRGGVQRIQLVTEPEAMTRRLLLTSGQQFMEQGLIKRMRLSLVDSGQRGTAHLSAAQVVELADLGGEIGDDIAQAGTSGQLAETERDELRPTGHFAQFLSLVMPIGQGFKFMSRNEF